MQKVLSIIKSSQSGMSLVEVLLAVAIFAVISTGLIGGIIYGQESTAVAGARERAVKIAEEGIEAVKNIRDSNFNAFPADGTYGLTNGTGYWGFNGASDTTDIFTRSVVLSTVDSRTRDVTVNVTWTQTAQRSGSISLNMHLADWVTAPTLYRKGMLVYGDGGNSTDAIKYQIYDDATGTWSVAAATADVDGASANKYLRAAKVYASPTRNEKVLISRHYNGAGQWIYAQVYNGTTGTWGNVVQLSTWNATTYLDVQNFDATYTANGNLTVVYSDNTTTPKSRVWDGSNWGSQASLNVFGSSQIPTYIVTRARPTTNEIMFLSFTQNNRTNTEYYSGSAWSTSTILAAASPANTKRLVDFAWSDTNNTKGAAVYTDNAADKSMDISIWTANGSGGGSWATAQQYGTAQANNIGALSIAAVKGTANFNVCNKDALATPQIICMRANTAGWIAASNVTVSTVTDLGIQKSFDLDSEQVSPDNLVLVYSDNSTTAKLKKFNIASGNWDAAATSLNPLAVGVVKTARVESNSISSDMMLFVTDANMDLYSVAWDGVNNQPFTTPAGKVWTAHGIQGSATTDYWYDFAWDGM
ncbi:MAG: prepilin-type N-terminal cleavage/methylation domain-containing protein [Candidatus Saccharibacteria bacterium]